MVSRYFSISRMTEKEANLFCAFLISCAQMKELFCYKEAGFGIYTHCRPTSDVVAKFIVAIEIKT